EEEIVEQEVTIIMQDSSGGDDPGGGEVTECSDDGVIAHTPLEAQRDAEPYSIEGSISDDEGNWDEVVLSWTLDDPLGEDPDYESETLELDGDQFSGEIPNPLLDSGETAEIAYTICAYSAREEDEVSCAPEEFVYRFNVYSPDDEGCRDDSVDMSEPERAGEMSFTEWDAFRTCEDKPKYHRVEAAEDEEVEAAVSFPAGVEPDIEMTADGEEVDVEMLPCIGLAYGVVEGPADIEVRVAADEFPYHVTAFRYGPECVDADYEPNETPDEATPITSDFASFEEMTICSEEDRDVFEVDLLPGDQFDAYTEVDDAEGNLALALYKPSHSDRIVEDGDPTTEGLTVDDGDWLSYTTDERGPHYLTVTTRDDPNDYELLTDRICGDDDQFAGNHSSEDAETVELGEYEDLKICSEDADFFRLEHEGDDDISWLGEVRVREGEVDDVDVTVRDEEGEEVGDIDTYDERIGFILTPEPDQTLEVEIDASDAVFYDLYVDEVAN
ncbi:MAG: hypothetical protein ACOCV2_10540, partial [Persicimonas sp.]